MANVFHNARQVMTTSMATAYTCPAATTAIVIGAQIANVNATATSYRLQWLDASNSNAVTRLGMDTPIPGNVSIAPITGKLVLEAGDVVQAYCSNTNGAELTLCVLEMS